jgi:putative transcriptional regulator
LDFVEKKSRRWPGLFSAFLWAFLRVVLENVCFLRGVFVVKLWWIRGQLTTVSWWAKNTPTFRNYFDLFLDSTVLLLIHNVIFSMWLFMLYNRIAVLRLERALSRQDLAREVGVNPQTIGFLERGDYTPSLELAFKLSRFFKLPVEAIFSPEPLRPLSEQVYEIRNRKD